MALNDSGETEFPTRTDAIMFLDHQAGERKPGLKGSNSWTFDILR